MQQLMMLRNAEFSAIANPNGFEKTEAGGAFKKYGRVTENVD